MSVTDSTVQRGILAVVARAAMLIALPVTVWIAGYVQGVGNDVTTLKSRVSIIENSLTIGRAQRDKQFDDVDKQFDKITLFLDKLDDRTISILQALGKNPEK